MSRKMNFLVIHCTDSPFTREVTPDDITMWHKGVRKNANGTYTFLGCVYTKKELWGKLLVLPSGLKIEALKTNGRGWSQVGYSDLIQRTGKIVNLVPWNMDDCIDSNEVTNGAAGYNSQSRHVVLAGGWSIDNKIKDGLINGHYFAPELLYSGGQLNSLRAYIKNQKEIVPLVNVVGHNELCGKTCPNFDIKNFLTVHRL